MIIDLQEFVNSKRKAWSGFEITSVIREPRMTVAEGVTQKKDEEKKSVLVGIRFDSSSRQLLNWALVKVAESGDRVVALHVCRDSETISEESTSLNDYLEVYDGLCNVKQVNLTGQILRESSVRKALVRAAKHCAAMAVVVGLSRQNALGGCFTMAKYCAKRLPQTTTVLAIHNGKVVFERSSTNQLPGLEGYPRPTCNLAFPSLKEQQPGFGNAEGLDNEKSSFQVVQTSEDVSRDGSGYSNDENFNFVCEFEEEVSLNSISLHLRELPESKLGWPLLRRATLGTPEFSDKEEVPSNSISTLLRELPESNLGWPLLRRATLSTPEFSYKEEVSSNSNSIPVRELPESMLGWPLLRRATLVTPEVLREPETKKVSVVQWVMSLPNRSSPVTPQNQIGTGTEKARNPFGREISNCKDRSKKRSLSLWEELPNGLELLLRENSSSCRWFSYQELECSTSQFSSENLIGKGGCGRVYKGCLPDGKPVAVKILKSSKEGLKDFALEVDIISSVKHKHITPLTGICIQDNDLISVYDFLSKGSLEENLHGKKDKSVLSWEVRFKVAIGVAEALNYLHKDCSRPVIHRDVKSSNILLSDDLEPQLSDFGLAIFAPTTSSYVTHSDVVGTFGYLAPEYIMYGKVSDKIDVYSYGVVLLELISGRKPIGTGNPKRQESLVIWAKPILESGDPKGILDPNLTGKFNKVQLHRMVLAATLCITRPAHLRPAMSKILELLRGEDIDDWMNSHVNVPKELDNEDDDEIYPTESPLSLSSLDLDNEISFTNVEQYNHQSWDGAYLRRQWSRSSSIS